MDRRKLQRPPKALVQIRDRLGTASDRLLGDEAGLDEDVVRYWRLKAGVEAHSNSARGALPATGPVDPSNPSCWLLACGPRLACMARMSPVSVQRIFEDEDRARCFLENSRWPDGPFCPACCEPSAKADPRQPIRCRGCRAQYTVRQCSILHSTKIPLATWLRILYLIETEPRASKAHWLAPEIGLTLKTSWMVLKRVQAARLGFTRWSRTRPELTR